MKALKIGELTARIPVIQGGMGVGISLSGLAGSVAACGGVGVISTAQIGYRDPEFEKNPIKTNLRVIGEEIQKSQRNCQGRDPGCEYHGGNEAVCGVCKSSRESRD